MAIKCNEKHPLFQLYIFVVTFIFKGSIKAQYLYTLLALAVSDREIRGRVR